MKRLPARSNLDHLKKQAKELLRSYREGDATAISRLRSCAVTTSASLRLHDAQLCLAREYGFSSWPDLKSYVETHHATDGDRESRVFRWLRYVYAGDVSGEPNPARPSVAQRMLAENPSLAQADPYLACAVGDENALRRIAAADAGWVNRAGGPLHLPPLVAVTHSSLVRLPAFRDGLHRCARFLLDAGADANQKIGNRWPPASLSAPSEESLSALYGAAGQNHDPELTALLLGAGANPNDGESLYHALESTECTRLLLKAGATIVGTNALYRVFDLDNISALRLLLSHGADPNEVPRNAPLTDFGSPLLWAIGRRRSRAHIEALLNAGADPFAKTPDGVSAYLLALRFGLTDVAELLRHVASDPISTQEQFLAACARADEREARRLLSIRPDLLAALSEKELRLLPDLVAAGLQAPVRLMVKLSWPIAARGGDFQASALNLAVFRGDAELTGFLLDHGANWREQHGYGDNVLGSLSWASCNEPIEGGDWLGCAEALVAHGLPAATRDAEHPECVLIDGRHKRFSEDVTEFLLGVRAQ